MIGTAPELPTDWLWQGFAGPLAVAATAKADTEARLAAGTLSVAVGVVVPVVGQPPATWTKNKGTGAKGLFAVQTRRSAPLVCPSGLEEADAALVGRLVGA